ncbi:hypothetical protein STEG23_018070, partial [Scotinomys teguina]
MLSNLVDLCKDTMTDDHNDIIYSDFAPQESMFSSTDDCQEQRILESGKFVPQFTPEKVPWGAEKKQKDGSCFRIHSDNLCLFIGFLYLDGYFLIYVGKIFLNDFIEYVFCAFELVFFSFFYPYYLKKAPACVLTHLFSIQLKEAIICGNPCAIGNSPRTTLWIKQSQLNVKANLSLDADNHFNNISPFVPKHQGNKAFLLSASVDLVYIEDQLQWTWFMLKSLIHVESNFVQDRENILKVIIYARKRKRVLLFYYILDNKERLAPSSSKP